MSSPLKVGDVVTLNIEGLETCFGSALGLKWMLTKRMRITDVECTSLTSPEATYAVEVDDPEINAFLLYDACFDLVKD